MNLGAIIEGLSDKAFPFKKSVACEGAEKLSLDGFTDFQEGLKNRIESDIIKILRSVRDLGFSFPFFYWKSSETRYVMDGHGRLLALQIFRQLGGQLPLFPACRVHAKSKDDAKQKLLRLNSRYGTIDLDGLKDFVDGLDINVDDLNLPDINIEDILIESLEEKEPEVQEKPEKTFVQIGDISESISPTIAEKIINIINRRKQKPIERFFEKCILLFPEPLPITDKAKRERR